MIIQRVVLILGGLLVVLGGGVLAIKGGSDVAIAGSTWIEVGEAHVYEIGNDGKRLRELKTGDDIKTPATIESDTTGKATVHLPDGSLLRLDIASKIIITEASFNPDTETLSVKVQLASGRVWSKVVALVTPESSWEVKTSNAVATVRGTAFFTEYKNGRSSVWSSQHTVAVKPIDPNTGIAIDKAEVLVKEKTILEFNNETAKAIAENKVSPESALIVRIAPKAITESKWVKDNEADDEKMEEKIKVMRDERLKEKIIREELRKEENKKRDEVNKLRKEKRQEKEIVEEINKEETKEEYRNKIKEEINIRLKTETEAEIFRSEEENIEEVKPEETETTGSVSGGGSSGGTNETIESKPVGLILVSPSNGPFVEGKRLQFKALLKLSNGSERDVTSLVSWKIEGRIGGIDSPGLFVAKMSEEDSEVGEAKGVIYAVFEGEGNAFTSNKSEVIVVPLIEETVPVG